MNEGQYQFADNKNSFVIKMSGNLRYTGSAGFDSFIEGLFVNIKEKDVFIDLCDALYLDSTNLGILAKVSDKMQTDYSKQTTIFSSNPDITQLLINIGFDDYFIIVNESPNNSEMLSDISEIIKDDRTMAEMMLEAHKSLMSLNSENTKMFESVVVLLEKEVGKEK